MRNFRTLFKYERRMLFPNSKRIDIMGGFTSLLFTLAIAGEGLCEEEAENEEEKEAADRKEYSLTCNEIHLFLILFAE